MANRAGYGGAAVSPPHLLRGSIQSDCGEMKAWLLDTGYRASEILGLSMTSGREGGEMQGTFNSHAGPKYPLVVCQSKVQISLPSLRLQLAESGRPTPRLAPFSGRRPAERRTSAFGSVFWFYTRQEKGAPLPEALQYRVDAWSGRSKPLVSAPGAKNPFNMLPPYRGHIRY